MEILLSERGREHHVRANEKLGPSKLNLRLPSLLSTFLGGRKRSGREALRELRTILLSELA